MKADDFDRDRALREALRPATACPPLAELAHAAFAGATTPANEALLAHAATCPACGAELALAGAFEASPRSAVEAEEIAWVAARMSPPRASDRAAGPAEGATPQTGAPPMARVIPMDRHRERSRRRSSGEPSLWSRWAAAALIVVGLGFAFEWAHRTIGRGGPPALSPGGTSLDPDVVRGGAILLESPLGRQSEAVREFTWRPGEGAAAYRVEIRDLAGDLVWQGLSPAPRLATPPDLAAKLETYVAYAWTVTALDASQSPLGQSQSARFTIEPAR
jgi:hypothetical protein